MLGNLEHLLYLANPTCPVRQMLLEIYSSDIRQYSSRTEGQVEFFFSPVTFWHKGSSVLTIPLLLLCLLCTRHNNGKDRKEPNELFSTHLHMIVSCNLTREATNTNKTLILRRFIHVVDQNEIQVK